MEPNPSEMARASATMGADTSEMAKASAHWVKWSVSTSIQVFPLADNSIGPTRSTATTCHG